ncbi:tetratricopeptide repeat protein, partial [Streptomyces shenzhenensis]
PPGHPFDRGEQSCRARRPAALLQDHGKHNGGAVLDAPDRCLVHLDAGSGHPLRQLGGAPPSDFALQGHARGHVPFAVEQRHFAALGSVACHRTSVDGQTEALLHITHARAYAAIDENSSAARALLAAENALLRDDGPQPSYSRVSGPAAGTVASHTARTLTDLADHVGTEQQHRDALTRWDPEKYKRVHALTHADLGDSLAAQARADEAVAAWTQALTLMEGMTSDRARKAITSIRSTLAVYQRRRVPGAADLARRAREALA